MYGHEMVGVMGGVRRTPETNALPADDGKEEGKDARAVAYMDCGIETATVCLAEGAGCQRHAPPQPGYSWSR